MCLDVAGKQAVIRRNAIRNTFARAITVHGTYGTDENNLGVSVSVMRRLFEALTFLGMIFNSFAKKVAKI